MSDSFMHKHQSALDSFMESKAIQDLEDAGIYPVSDNDAILENIAENYQIVKTTDNPDFFSNEPYSGRYVIRDENNQIVRYGIGILSKTSWTFKEDAEKALSEIVKQRFEEEIEDKDFPYEEENHD